MAAVGSGSGELLMSDGAGWSGLKTVVPSCAPITGPGASTRAKGAPAAPDNPLLPPTGSRAPPSCCARSPKPKPGGLRATQHDLRGGARWERAGGETAWAWRCWARWMLAAAPPQPAQLLQARPQRPPQQPCPAPARRAPQPAVLGKGVLDVAVGDACGCRGGASRCSSGCGAGPAGRRHLASRVLRPPQAGSVQAKAGAARRRDRLFRTSPRGAVAPAGARAAAYRHMRAPGGRLPIHSLPIDMARAAQVPLDHR